MANVIDALMRRKSSLQQITSAQSGWWPWIREPYTGAWQRNDEWSVETVLAHHAVFACITLIAADIGKLRQRLVKLDGKIWKESRNNAHSPYLRRPNRYQNQLQYKQWMTMSKLTRGNSYAVKQRDNRNVVIATYPLDPTRVTVLVSPDGDIFYRLSRDNLSGIEEGNITVPASEIVHDRMNPIFHPLIGVSPIFACGVAANMGLKIQNSSQKFFTNNSQPSGILTAPGGIGDETAARAKAYWESEYTGENAGKVAVLGDGLHYEPLAMTAVDSQLIEQLKWTAEVVCSVFHVPPFKIGIGQMPTYQNGELLDQIYYNDCLQSLIEDYEAVHDDALGLGEDSGVDLDLRGLLRMDSATHMKTLTEGVKGSIYTPNEAREELNKPELEGGDTVYMQQQNFSLAALNARDTGDDPFKSAATPPASVPAAADEPDDSDAEDQAEEKAAAEQIGLIMQKLCDIVCPALDAEITI